MQTETYQFSANTKGAFAPVTVGGLTHYEAAIMAQKIADKEGVRVNASFLTADGTAWPDERIGNWGMVSPCAR